MSSKNNLDLDLIKKYVLSLEISQEELIILSNKAIDWWETSLEDLGYWVDNRLKPNLFRIDDDWYARMCIDALKTIQTTTPSDYWSSRQRDMLQIWWDTIRWYLAEYAVLLFFKTNWGIDVRLWHEQGNLEDYLNTDIYSYRIKKWESFKKPLINIWIKWTKFNWIWLDMPGNQFSHSHIQILVKVWVSRDHLLAYLNHINVFKDNLFKKWIELWITDKTEVDDICWKLPKFSSIFAYIAGFVVTWEEKYMELDYKGKKWRKNYEITSWNWPFNKEKDLEIIKKKESVDWKIKFLWVGEFAHSGYLFNAWKLLWKKEDWERYIIEKL